MTVRIGKLEIPAGLLTINPHLRPAKLPSDAPTFVRVPGLLTVTIPGLALKLTANSRVHWAERGRAVATQRAMVTSAIALQPCPALPCVVTITRVGPRRLDDDNAVGSAKGCRDAIARWLGVDDGDPRVTWRVVQELGPYAVRIAVST